MNTTELGHFQWVRNKNREFGSSNGWYAGYINVNGKTVKAMLTDSDVQTISARADDNPEDMPRLARKQARYPLFSYILTKLTR